jgi:hypothetical protein
MLFGFSNANTGSTTKEDDSISRFSWGGKIDVLPAGRPPELGDG